MAQIEELLKSNGLISEEKTKKNNIKLTPGRQLINNLIERVSRRGNLMIEMEGHFVSKIRIPMSSNYFNKNEKNFNLWVQPYTIKSKNGRHYLMLEVISDGILGGLRIRASEIFGKGINSVKL